MDEVDRALAEYLPERDVYSSRVKVNHMAKRGLDVVVSATGLIVSSPLLLALGIATYFDSGRPIIFSQRRLGYWGEYFRIYKFRTMRQDTMNRLDELVGPEANDVIIPYDSDAYTRVGRFLSRNYLDELLQLWNVLKGEMSLVGPRPIMPEAAVRRGISKDAMERYRCPQGITGMTQLEVKFGRGEGTAEQLDKYYAEVYREGNVFFLDIKILLATALGLTKKMLRR